MSPINETLISDNINALIRTSKTSAPIEHYDPDTETWQTTKETHQVEHPSLIDQLRTNITTTTMADSDIFTGNMKSKPPTRLDAIALLQRIDRQGLTLLRTLRAATTGSLETRLSRISGTAASTDQATANHIRTITRSWVISARIITGWETPPFQPNVPCPNVDCERRSSLRIDLNQQIAACTECGTYWDTDNVNRLGTYVRWAAEHLTGPRHWLTDDNGFPTECVECLQTRQDIAERQITRANKADTRTAGAA